jgi:hypothetical protein
MCWKPTALVPLNGSQPHAFRHFQKMHVLRLLRVGLPGNGEKTTNNMPGVSE